MANKEFKPHHINAASADLAGNNGIGRYILIPGSNGRAEQIAEHFDGRIVKSHPRGHHLYLGTVQGYGTTIDVATISSGMGCPSMEIILHELFHLGGKRFLRVGSAGSLQADMIKMGDIINVSASVRDEKTTNDYMPVNVPAIASLEFIQAITEAATILNLRQYIHTGVVHCKSSLYAREFGEGPRHKENLEYLNLLTQCGVLASEMESAALFIQSQLYRYQLMRQGTGPQNKVFAGAILGIYSSTPEKFIATDQEQQLVNHLISLALESVKLLAKRECT